MPQGLEVFNGSGVRVLSVTDRITRFLGSTYVAGDGSLYVPDFSQGQPWYYLIPAEAWLQNKSYPLLGISGQTLSWTYSGRSNGAACWIAYGIY
jgi:hypothetical protein